MELYKKVVWHKLAALDNGRKVCRVFPVCEGKSLVDEAVADAVRAETQSKLSVLYESGRLTRDVDAEEWILSESGMDQGAVLCWKGREINLVYLCGEHVDIDGEGMEWLCLLSDTFTLCVGTVGCHPMVAAQDFDYVNTDGSAPHMLESFLFSKEGCVEDIARYGIHKKDWYEQYSVWVYIGALQRFCNEFLRNMHH